MLNPDQIVIAVEDPESVPAKACLQSYYDTLSTALGERFDPGRSLDPDRDALRAPLGIFLVAWAGGDALGCCGLKGTGGVDGEVKRLWVADAARGLGLGKRLMIAVEDQARALGMTRLRLDTNKTLKAAIAMYRATGWREIPDFNGEPYAHHWFEKDL